MKENHKGLPESIGYSAGHGYGWNRSGLSFQFAWRLLVFLGVNLILFGFGVGLVVAALLLGS